MRSVAAILALFITAIAFIDPVCCPDGCTRTDLAATTNHSADRGGACPICQPGAIAAMPTLPAALLQLATATLRVDQPPLDSLTRSIEHPPRS